MSSLPKDFQLVSNVNQLERCLKRIFTSVPLQCHDELIHSTTLAFGYSWTNPESLKGLAAAMIKKFDEEQREKCISRLWQIARQLRVSIRQFEEANSKSDILRRVFTLRSVRPRIATTANFSRQPPFRLLFPDHLDQNPIRLFIPKKHALDSFQRHAFLAQHASLEWDIEDQRFRIANLSQDHFFINSNKYDDSLFQSQPTDRSKYVCSAKQLLGQTLQPLEIELMTLTCRYFRQLLPVLLYLRHLSTNDTAAKILSYLVTNQEMEIFLQLDRHLNVK